MFRQRKAAKRFSLLLLEEEEDYVQDWVVACKWPAEVSGCWAGAGAVEGRIRLATRSLFFDPDDIKLPIVRLPFASTESLKPGGGPGAAFSLTCTSVTKMKANMEEAPYAFEKHKGATWVFTLLYAPLSAFLPVTQQLVAACKLSKPQRTAILEEFVRSREDACSFDTSRLADFSEQILLDVPAIQLTPLVRERGHLVVTNTRIYFQPMHNVSGDTPVRSHPLAGIAALARRRSCLRPLGLELFFVRPSDTHAARSANPSLSGRHKAPSSTGLSSTGPASLRHSSTASLADLELLAGGQVWDKPSAFFAFRSEQDRESVITQLRSCPDLGAAVPRAAGDKEEPGGFASLVQAHSHLLEAQGGWLYRVTAAWQQALISNFDYLMYLNLAAGRSFNDLAQYPVFPWVLSNWVSEQLDLNNPECFRDLSKPVGALSPGRLAEFRKRYEDMCEDNPFDDAVRPFMYGTHYSTPGFVMYWLLRAAPAHMLRLQNGRFDAPDRLFHCMEESWTSCNTSSTDVKELIPEFFLPGGIWLVNAQRLALGVRQNGHHVADVILPPWAKDTEHFLSVHRSALEAPYVSEHLHQWIDLIFGYKQNGPAAVEADNVFYYLTYEGAVDVSKVTDPLELKAYETQINEFGQTPRQLFKWPHPARTVIPPAPDPATVFKDLTNETVGGALSTGPATPASSANNLMAVGGSETGHRALALALISAISTAATVEGLPEPPSSPPAPQESVGRASPVPAPVSSPAQPFGSERLQTVTATRSFSGAAAPGSPQRHMAPSVLGTASLVNSAAGIVSSAAGMVSTAGGMVSSAGGMLAGLLKMRRTSSPGIVQSEPGSTSSVKSSSGRPAPSSPTLSNVPASGGARAETSRMQRQGTATSSNGLASVSESGPGPVPASSTPASRSLSAQMKEAVGANPVVTAGKSAAGTVQGGAAGTVQGDPAQDQPGPNATGSIKPVTGSGLPQPSPAQPEAAAVNQPTLTAAEGEAEDQDRLSDCLNELADLHSILQLEPVFPNSPNHIDTADSSVAAPPAAGKEPSVQQQQQQQQPPMRIPSCWSEGVPDRLHASHNSQQGSTTHCSTLNVSRDAVTGVASWRPPGGTSRFVYCTNSAGLLRVLQLDGPSASPSHSTLRLQQLDSELLCVSTLHTRASTCQGQHGMSHPLILTGSHNRHVHAYCVERGQLQGSFQAHDDAVCAIAIPAPASGGQDSNGHVGSVDVQPARRFFTSSWDCTIKAWSLGTGSEPWAWHSSSLAPSPEAAWDLEQGVWALAAGQEGSYLVVGGTEEGHVVACDLRASRPAWNVGMTQDYIGGIALSSCDRFITLGAADGSLSLMDVRKVGSTVACVQLDSPVRCLASDGRLSVAGVESGSLHLWDVGLMSAGSCKPVGRVPPAPDGLYRPWIPPVSETTSPAAIAALAVSPFFAAGSNSVCVDVVLGMEDGSVVVVEAA